MDVFHVKECAILVSGIGKMPAEITGIEIRELVVCFGGGDARGV